MSGPVNDRPALARRLATPRLVATFALFVLSAVLFCAVAGFVLVRQADDRQESERRAALLGSIEDMRAAGVDVTRLDSRHIRLIERTAGLRDLRFERDPAEAGRVMQSVLDVHGRIIGWFSWEPERFMSKALGSLTPLLVATGLFLVGFAGVALWFLSRTVRDLGASERLAWQLAHEDKLTGLPNHRRMLEQIDDALAARPAGGVVALALADLDSFADVNDAFGQKAGDELLVSLAERLKETRPSGASGGRFDGDQFAILMTAADAEAAQSMAQTMAAALARPYWIDGHAVQLGATTGLAIAPRDADGRDELIRCADLALRSAKRQQRGTMLRFAAAMNVEFEERRFIERELKRALADKTLDVHYQPIVTSDGARIVGAEALLRWAHPERGSIAPAAFVPVAERCGLMAPLGEFVLRKALSDARRWPDLYISVNLSPVQVRDPALARLVSDLLTANGIAPARLVLEVTEGVLIDNPDEAKARLDALKALGLKLALDDFGTGYSSLTYLQRFPFDKLKIDKGFVAPLGRAANSQAVVQAIVALGRALELLLLAEGVETEEQRVLLRLAGCEEMQGYLFARPAPRETLDRVLEDARAAANAARPMVRAAIA